MLKNCDNFRDMGGIVMADGRILKQKKVIRSGKLSRLTEPELTFLKAYGLHDDVDFRSKAEQKHEPDRIPAGVNYHFVSVFPIDETNSTNEKWESRRNYYTDDRAALNDMLEAYKDIVLEDSSKKAYRTFFDVLLANTKDDESVLFHCSAGKDRTGMGAVYLLTALGADKQTIRQDYLASNQYLKAQQIKDHQEAQPKGAIFTQNIDYLGMVSEQYLDHALAVMQKEYGTVAQYLASELQLTKAQQKDLRQLYLK